MKHYTIKCNDCNETRKVGIVPTAMGDRIDWLNDDPQEKIVSGRQRLDGQFGWQCLCGNNSLLSSQEEQGITNKVSPDPKEVQQIVQNLIPEKTNFEMVSA